MNIDLNPDNMWIADKGMIEFWDGESIIVPSNTAQTKIFHGVKKYIS